MSIQRREVYLVLKKLPDGRVIDLNLRHLEQ